MMLTEQEAITKICPILDVDRHFRPYDSVNEYRAAPLQCRASKCMAWRLGRLPNKKAIEHAISAEECREIIEKDLDDPQRPEGIPQSYIFTVNPRRAYWVEDDESCEARRKGYCGLVGLPKGAE